MAKEIEIGKVALEVVQVLAKFEIPICMIEDVFKETVKAVWTQKVNPTEPLRG